LFRSYKSKSLPSDFYESHLQSLFYDVFNMPRDIRKQHIQNSYLNGGLFREVVEHESQCGVDDDILERNYRAPRTIQFYIRR
ncbi:MAG: hypothetical protein WAK17_16085, partial [Candidatus Nitrosopolaris sp.]